MGDVVIPQEVILSENSQTFGDITDQYMFTTDVNSIKALVVSFLFSELNAVKEVLLTFSDILFPETNFMNIYKLLLRWG